jgi:hypothetical protein
MRVFRDENHEWHINFDDGSQCNLTEVPAEPSEAELWYAIGRAVSTWKAGPVGPHYFDTLKSIEISRPEPKCSPTWTQKERNALDFHLANIEQVVRGQRATFSERENARLSAKSLRMILNIFHIPGEPDACDRATYDAAGEKHNHFLRSLDLV